MYHNLFRTALLFAAMAVILAACGAPIPTLAPATKASTATEALSAPTEMAQTNTPESTTTQVVLSVIADRIAFQSNRDGNNEIYVMNGDRSRLTNLTNNPADDIEPAWSPDGSRIAFWTNRDGNHEIYVMNADGSDQTNLTDNPAEDAQPSWSPDGKKIVFTSDRDGNHEIYIMNADGSGQINLTKNPAGDELPDWSPDGAKIVFASDPGGIRVMNADGSNPTLLEAGPNAFPKWSPDGEKIAFWSNKDGNAEVYVMDTNGSNVINLTNNPADDVVFGWSSDGMQIAFDSDRGNNRDIYVINLDGSGLTRLTDDQAYDGAPSLGQP
jgi:Tol biopolymer transport system component